MSDLQTKACPFCGEQILMVAVKCRYCHSMLEPLPSDNSHSGLFESSSSTKQAISGNKSVDKSESSIDGGMRSFGGADYPQSGFRPKVLLTLVAVILSFIGLVASNPEKEDFEKFLRKKINEEVSKEKKNLGFTVENVFAKALVEVTVETGIEMAVRNWSERRHDYFIFSVFSLDLSVLKMLGASSVSEIVFVGIGGRFFAISSSSDPVSRASTKAQLPAAAPANPSTTSRPLQELRRDAPEGGRREGSGDQSLTERRPAQGGTPVKPSYTVYTTTPLTEEVALQAVEQLRSEALAGQAGPIEGSNSSLWFVRAGPYESLAAADRAVSFLRSRGYTIEMRDGKSQPPAITTMPPGPAQLVPLPTRALVEVCPNYKAAIKQSLVYPREALLDGIQGQVVLTFTVTAGGQVKDVAIKSSSSRVFNSAALAAVRQVSCAGQGQDIVGVELPIDFTIN